MLSPCVPLLHSLQLTHEGHWSAYRAGISDLLARYQAVLLDDTARRGKSGETLQAMLLANVASCMPNVWVLVDVRGGVYALCALADIIPGRHAYVHGAMRPEMRRNPLINDLVDRVFQTAFAQHGVLKIKAEFEADNRLAKGFCLRMGFVREAYFKRDNAVNGQLRDVAVYSLFAEAFHARRKNALGGNGHA